MGEKVLTSRESPWVRDEDQFGELGLAPQSLFEQIKILILAVTILPAKLFGATACLLSYYGVIKVSFLLPESVRSDWVATLGKIHCRACLFCLGFIKIKWIKVHDDNKPTKAAVGIVSNHSSWVDILIHMSHYFPAFAARDATKDTPIIGAISQAMGCLYVDRLKSRAEFNIAVSFKTPGIATMVKQRMEAAESGNIKNARPLLLFPEGTTTNGNFILPFKTGAFLAGAPLQPVLIRYKKGRISPSWETITAPRHIFLMLCNPIHHVTCYELPVYVPNEEEKGNPRLFADNVRNKMIEFSGLKPSALTYEDKMVYFDELKRKYGMLDADGNVGGESKHD